MTTSATAVVTGISYELGASASIDPLPEVSESPELHDALVANGLANFREARKPVGDMLAAAASATLATAGVTTGDVAAVVVATGGTRWTLNDEAEAMRALAETGLVDVECVGVSMSEAANGNVALRMAALLADAHSRPVLVALVDAAPSEEGRVTPPDITLASDGAVTCLVEPPGRAVAGSFDLLRTASGWNAALGSRALDADTLGAYAAFQLAGLDRACEEATGATGMARNDLPLVVTPNLAVPLVNAAAVAVGLSPAQLYLDNVARNGHVQACDPFVNLVDAVGAGRVRPGDPVLVFASGRYTWSASVLRTR